MPLFSGLAFNPALDFSPIEPPRATQFEAGDFALCGEFVRGFLIDRSSAVRLPSPHREVFHSSESRLL
jgi:hypothetical protein